MKLLSEEKIAIPRVHHPLKKTPDFLARQFFRDYSTEPAKNQLARQPASETPNSRPRDMGPSTELVPGVYKVTRILYRNHVVPENETADIWFIDKNTNWYVYGTAHNYDFATSVEDRRDDGTYPVLLSRNKIRCLASFHGGKMVFVVPLLADATPDSMTPSGDSPFVRLELEKIADRIETTDDP